MKKLFTLFVLAFMLTFNANAQLANGSIAPDWTLTDINGNEWNLYSILDEGKSVVIDFSATWCGPCWNYHNTHALKDVYETYGPDGTDEMMVFFIEGDGDTTMEDLQGTGGSTQGDWITGTPYPIIDNASQNDAYAIGYWPTVYHICPNRILTEMGQANVANHYQAHNDCLPIGGANNAALLDYTDYEGLFCGTLTTAPSVILQNLADDNLTSAELQLTINGNLEQTKMWSGDLSQFSFEEVAFDEVDMMGDNDIEVVVTVVNGTDDEDDTGNTMNASVQESVSSQSNMVTVEITTDNYGAETYWQITNANGDVIAYGGNENVGPYGGGLGEISGGPGAYGNNANSSTPVTIPENGCYDFLIVDAFGDGICCAYGTGSFTLTASNGDILGSGGEFEETLTIPFEITGAVSTDELIAITDMTLSPNPVTTDVMTIDFTLAETTDMEVAIFNTLGQKVTTISNTTYTAGNSTITANVNDYANGVYYLVMTSNNKQTSKRFIVSK